MYMATSCVAFEPEAPRPTRMLPVSRPSIATALRPLAIVVLTLLFAVPVRLSAQVFSITAGSATSCSGLIEDSGGPSGEYGNNENYTFTICPDQAGNVVYLNWIVFDLSTEGQNPDQLAIYDGNSTAATFMGSYTGTQLQGLIVSGTVFNTTGCLTLVFTSNGSGTGNFAASFQCTVPCEYPTAVATMDGPIPNMICQGTTVTFDGTASTAQGSNTLVEYLWDFDDGTTSTSGPVVSHTFNTPGEYVVQLYVTDDNGCSNLNLVDLQILVSTTPTFNITVEEEQYCAGAEVTLIGQYQPTTWTGIPDANFGEPIFLPDDVGTPFNSTLTFTQFNSGQTLESVNDLLSVCVEMEHSFMGDLVIQIICPNGQSTIMHQQNGGGTYLGAANDTDTGMNPVPGECWEYCWAPTGTLTWVQAVAAGGYTTPAGTPTGQALIPGTYASVQPFSNLIGCPLNGDWTFQTTDLWGLDNGFICSWSLNFNPTIIPDVTQFTPSIGIDSDSSFWQTPIPPDYVSANADTIVFHVNTPGQHEFVYNVVDNFGCAYDTTVVVNVNEPFLVEAGPDVTICDGPVQLSASIGGATTNCTWTLQMNDSWGDGWNGASLVVNIGGVPTTYTATGSGTTVQLTVPMGAPITLTFNSGTWDGEITYQLINDQGVTVHSAGPNPPTGLVWSGTGSCGGFSGLIWSWTPTEGLSDPNIANPTALVTSTTVYHVSGHIPGQPGCVSTDSVTVMIDPALDPGEDNTYTVCSTEEPFDLIYALAGTPQVGGTWTFGGNTVSNMFNPASSPAGVYTYTVTNAAGCVGTAQVTLTVLPVDHPDCCGIADAGPGAVLCELTYGLHATPGNTGVGQWSGPPGYVFANPLAPQTIVTAPYSGPATFYWIEDDGVCYLIDSVTVVFSQPLQVSFSSTDAICYQACDGSAQATVVGGLAPLSLTWSNGTTGAAATDLCAGSYTFTVVDANACTLDSTIVIAQPPQLHVEQATYAEPWCHGDCNASITINDPDAVLYSYDGGVTFTTSNTLGGLCSGNYSLAIQNAAGCIGLGQIAVHDPLPVVADFVHNPVPTNINAPTIYFSSTSYQATSFMWDFAGLGTATGPNPAFTFSDREPGEYTVCLTALNPRGCADTICHLVTIDDILFTYFPNAFTPNGDGHNDTWGMVYNIDDVAEFELYVYDRWGHQVFSATDPRQRWDGSFNGSVVRDGVYVWTLKYRTISVDHKREINGFVTVVR